VRGRWHVSSPRTTSASSCPPEDPERLAQAARELLASPEQMRLLAGRGRRYVVENRTRSRLVAAFVSMATRLVESRTEAPR